MQKIIIDTDIGDDVDDALAIALALQSPELELIGVTTVYKNVELRAKLAQKLLRLLGAEHIPVCVGAGNPLVKEIDITEKPYQCVNVENEVLKETMHGANFIVETVKNNPEVVVIAIGPMTNLALAIRLAPAVMSKAKIVLMGGAFEAIYPEWNILCDPEAANIVLKSGADVTMVGLDVTAKCVLSAEHLSFIAQAKGEGQQLLADLVDIWMNTSKGKKVTLHDPLTVAYVAKPELLKVRRAPVVVELSGIYGHASTMVMEHPYRKKGPTYEENVQIATDVNADQICQFVMERVFQSNAI